MGTIIHALLADWFSHQDSEQLADFVALYKTAHKPAPIYTEDYMGVTIVVNSWEIKTFDEMVDSAASVVLAFLLWLGDRWEVLSIDNAKLIEHRFDVNMPIDVGGLHGYIDLVVKMDDKIYVVDFKTRTKITHEDLDTQYSDHEFAPQLYLYAYALQRLGIQVDGFIRMNILQDVPAEPSVNKNGTMSRQNIRTTWEFYKNSLQSVGLESTDYEDDMKPKFEKNQFYFMEVVTVTRHAIMEYITNSAEWLLAIERSSFPRNEGHNCTFCAFKHICKADILGEHQEEVRRTMYVDKV